MQQKQTLPHDPGNGKLLGLGCFTEHVDVHRRFSGKGLIQNCINVGIRAIAARESRSSTIGSACTARRISA